MPHFELAGNNPQYTTLFAWAVLTSVLVNWGGRNNRNFKIVVHSGYSLIVVGVAAAGIVKVLASHPVPENIFTDAAVNFMLILAASIGANYIAHANMNLRDRPKGSNGPKPDQPMSTAMPAQSSKTQPTHSKTARRRK